MDSHTHLQTFNVTPPAKLTVKNIRGSVVVRAGKADEIRIQAVLDPNSGNVNSTRIEIGQDEDGSVLAMTHTDSLSGVFGRGSNPCKVNYTIYAPSECDIDLNNVSSSAVLEGFQGKFDLSTVSGNLAISNLAGELKVNSVSGDVTGLRLSNTLGLKTVSGDVKLGSSQLNKLQAKSVSGDIYTESPFGEGPYNFDTVSGDVRMIVPPETGCEIQMNTFSGNVFVGLSSTYIKQTGKLRHILVQDGGPLITFKSMSGDLEIITPDQLTQPTPDQPKPQINVPEEPDRMAILDRIGRGELSVDEGIKLLESE